MCFSESKCLKKYLRINNLFLVFFFTIGRINRSNFGGFRVNPSPTKQGFVTKRFHTFS
jgi:hypothetical protein